METEELQNIKDLLENSVVLVKSLEKDKEKYKLQRNIVGII